MLLEERAERLPAGLPTRRPGLEHASSRTQAPIWSRHGARPEASSTLTQPGAAALADFPGLPADTRRRALDLDLVGAAGGALELGYVEYHGASKREAAAFVANIAAVLTPGSWMDTLDISESNFGEENFSELIQALDAAGAWVRCLKFFNTGLGDASLKKVAEFIGSCTRDGRPQLSEVHATGNGITTGSSRSS